MCAIFVFVQNSSDVWIYVAIMSSSFLISQLIMWTQIKKYIVFVKVPLQNSVEELKPIFTLFVPIIAYTIYRIMDKIMLGSITGDMVQMGWYENAEKIISMPVGLITALGTVMLPRMSNLSTSNKTHKQTELIINSFVFSTLIAFSTAMGLIATGKMFASVFFGDEFYGCGELIVLLSLTIPFVAWANVIRTQFLIPTKKDKVYLISTTLGAVLNLIFNILFIPKFGAKGAVYGSIIAESSVFITQFVCTAKQLPYKRFFSNSLPYILSSLIMLVLIKMVDVMIVPGIGGLCFEVLFGVFVFGVCVILYSFVGKDSISIFVRKFIKK